MAKSYGNLGRLLSEPLPPDIQAAEDRRIAEFIAGLPDAEGTFGGHMVMDACYRLGGCGPGCPPGIRVDAAKLAGHDGIAASMTPYCGRGYPTGHRERP